MSSCCQRLSQVVPLDQSSIATMATDQPITFSVSLDQSHHQMIMDERADGFTSNHEDYEFFQSIGIGCYGIANIQLSRHKPTNRIIVVRQFDLESLDTDKLEEVQNEMKYSSLLSHPNILSYHCSFVSDTLLWAIQPLMHYGSCADLMHSAQSFCNGFRENVIVLVIYVRAKHFRIHEGGRVKLSGIRNLTSTMDSGARKRALHGHFQSTGDNICWLAPEVLAQDLFGYTYKSDIYSIGIAALELATGEAPFAGLPLTEIMMLKLRGHPPMLMRRHENVDPIQDYSKTFFKVVDMCVDPNPLKRPNTTKLLSLSFLKSSRKKSSVIHSSLKDLLLPVVPLNTESLSPPAPLHDQPPPPPPSNNTAVASTPVDPPFRALTLDEPWLI
ncbi:PREDICTED: STE20-related kinase adapter protein alpha-like [Amphimedon queenslandica]|uniref:Protein kinase domain-containing protein n=3 Tax=Amphimedon queenslandica TaxID=400682 RepID=A0AAN0J4K8_AMPQE|nr:PREDICTED: STE20-related kinase adapter protein alpha-like [Amphimedon queenslandica]|eukprot:XP_019851681.1 PREDICTED: STE20-related kinase adapter protein alpha-like [Amphimedon queenslandica]